MEKQTVTTQAPSPRKSLTRFVRSSEVRKHAKVMGRRVSPEFLCLLDAFVQERLDCALGVHNGGKKTLDATVAGYAGIKPKAGRAS